MRIWKTSTRIFALSILLLASTWSTPNMAATTNKRPTFAEATYQPPRLVVAKPLQEQHEKQQKEVEEQKRKQQAIQREQAQQQRIEENLETYTHLSQGTVEFILQEAKRKHVPASIVFGLMEQESTFRTDAVNPSTGATGLGQIEHLTANHLANLVGEGDLYDPIYNSRLAIFYLQYLHERTGDWNATLTAYNRGLGGLSDYENQYGTVSSDYSRSVLHRSQNIRQLTGAS